MQEKNSQTAVNKSFARTPKSGEKRLNQADDIIRLVKSFPVAGGKILPIENQDWLNSIQPG